MTTPTDLTLRNKIQQAATTLRQHTLRHIHTRQDVPNPNDLVAWIRHDADIGDIAYTNVSWQHGNVNVIWNNKQISMLDVVVELQQAVWRIEPERCTTVLDMTIIDDTGGSILYAYQKDKGLTPEGWLGFSLSFGARSGILASRFLAVREGHRSSGIARDLKLLQAYLALRANHHAIEWTYDPMRSANANLNLNRLGGYVHRYLENKYGEFRSELYGPVPSHRFFVRWNLIDDNTLNHLASDAKHFHNIDTATLIAMPSLNTPDFQTIIDQQPPQMRFGIPYDVDKEDDFAAMVLWRENFHAVCTQLIDSKQPLAPSHSPSDPALVGIKSTTGQYEIIAYVMADDAASGAKGHYVFARKDRKRP